MMRFKKLFSGNKKTATKRLHSKFLAACGLAIFVLACQSANNTDNSAQPTTQNVLTDAEKAAGWILLFDGNSFAGWRGLGREGIPEGHWVIEAGCIKKFPAARRRCRPTANRSPAAIS